MVKKLRFRFTATSALVLAVILAVVGVTINMMNYYNFIASTEKTMSVIASNNGEFPDYEDYLKLLEAERAREEAALHRTETETETEAETEASTEDEAETETDAEETAEEDATAEDTVWDTAEETVEETETGTDAETETETETETVTETETETSPAETLLDKFDYTAGFGFGLNVTAETAYETRYFYVRFTPDNRMIGYDLTHIAQVTKEEAEQLGREMLRAERDSGVFRNYRYYRHGTEGGATEIIFLNCATQLRNVTFILYISIATLVAVLAAVTAGIWFMSKKIVKPFVDNLNKQKKFITDAGHELKTPLSIIDANAEVLKLTGGDNEWIDSIQNQTSRLGALVKRLVSLAKSEEDLSDLKFEEFNISDAALDAVSPFGILAEKGGVTLSSSIEEGVKYKGNEASIRQLFGILLDNAIKYTPRGGKIYFTLTSHGRCTVEVTNDCEGLDTSKLSDLFDRFYRADDARSRETGGYGIGLSIAKAVAEAHRGKITATSRETGKVTFTVTL